MSLRLTLVLLSIFLPHLLHYYDDSCCLHQLSLKGPVAVSVIIFLVQLHADYVSLRSLSVSQPGLPICFHSNEVVEKKRKRGWRGEDESKGEEQRERERIGKGEEKRMRGKGEHMRKL